MKILVTGNSGSGKSTLSRLLAEKFGLKRINLDSIVWLPGWQRPSSELVNAQLDAIASQPSWIVDGVSSKLWNAADVVIFLDYSRRISFYRCAKRNWRYLFKSRPELPERCPEILVLPTLLKIIWQFPHTVRPKLLRDLKHSPQHTLIIIQNHRDLQKLLRIKTLTELHHHS